MVIGEHAPRGVAKHLLGPINDALNISKIEAEAIGVYLETFPAEPMIQDIVVTMLTLAEKDPNTLKSVPPAQLGPFTLEPPGSSKAGSFCLGITFTGFWARARRRQGHHQ